MADLEKKQAAMRGKWKEIDPNVRLLLSDTEVSFVLGVSPAVVRRMRYRGELAFVRLGHKSPRIPVEEVTRLLQKARRA